jgi:hypothetical protein
MELELIREIGLWAGEIGNLVAMGMGEMLESFNASSANEENEGGAGGRGEDQIERLGFADIVSESFPLALDTALCECFEGGQRLLVLSLL